MLQQADEVAGKESHTGAADASRVELFNAEARTNSLFGLLPSCQSDELNRVFCPAFNSDSYPTINSQLEPSFSIGQLTAAHRTNSSHLMISDSYTRDRERPPKPIALLENPTEQDKAFINLVETVSVKRAPIITIVNPPKQLEEVAAKPYTRKQSSSVHLKRFGLLTAPSQPEEEHSYRSEYLEPSRNESPVEQATSEDHNPHNLNARPDKNMKKIIFTPFKRILHEPKLKDDYGIDLADYFRICPNTRYGHRTWMDFEIVFWFVEERYRQEQGAFKRFLDYMNGCRKDIDDYGRTSYGKLQDKEWLKVYKKYTECIYKAMNSEQTSEGRLGILYGKRCPSQHAIKNLEEKKSRFIKARLITKDESV